MATYVNDLRLTELATGEGSGTWGVTTNTNLELIGEALGYGTQDCFATDADATTTVADGATDPARAMYFKVTSSATLTATRTLTIGPNTVSRVMLIENATTGSQSIAISQGSGGNVTIASGQVKMVYLDGAGAGAAVVDALADLELGTITVANLTATTADINGGTIDGATIGGASAAAGTFTTLNATGGGALTGTWSDLGTVTTVDINGGTIDGATIGGASAGAGTFTNLTASGTVSFSGATVSDGGTVTTVNIDGGSIDGTIIGAASPAAGTFTTVTGTGFASTGDMTFGDNAKAIFGAGSDLQIYHDGSNSRIDDTGTGNLILRGSSAVSIQKYTGETLGVFNADGSVLLAYDNATKFETTATGIDVTGTVTADGLTVSGNAYVGAGNFFTDATSGYFFGGNGSYTNGIYGIGTNNVAINANGSERMRITSAGDVGIGISSPAAVSTLKAVDIRGTDGAAVRFGTSSGITGFLAGSASSIRLGTGNALPLLLETNGSEKARLDASGNLLVGKTSTSGGIVGSVIASSGLVRLTADGIAVAEINRLTSDGPIVDFRKDGTTVGSIGSLSGTAYVAGSSKGIRFGSAGLIPATSAGANSDNTFDLGDAAVRWKNLYLSGGVYLGGTAAANLLDDYEEGTWTPVLEFGGASVGITYTVQSGQYTKIGNLVTGKFIIVLSNKGSSSGDAGISGLPFTVGAFVGNVSLSLAANFSTNIPEGGYVQNTPNSFILWSAGSTGTSLLSEANFNNNTRLDMSFSYTV